MYHETFSNSQIETNMNKVSEGKKLYYKSYLLNKVSKYRVLPVLHFRSVRLNTSSGEKKCIDIKIKGITYKFTQ